MVGVSHDRFGNLTLFLTIHIVTVLKVSGTGLTVIIVVREHLTNLPEDLEAIGGCSIGTGNGPYKEGGHLTREVAIRVARGQIDYDPVSEIGTLGGIKRVGEINGTGVVLDDDYILVFQNKSPLNLFFSGAIGGASRLHPYSIKKLLDFLVALRPIFLKIKKASEKTLAFYIYLTIIKTMVFTHFSPRCHRFHL